MFIQEPLAQIRLVKSDILVIEKPVDVGHLLKLGLLCFEIVFFGDLAKCRFGNIALVNLKNASPFLTICQEPTKYQHRCPVAVHRVTQWNKPVLAAFAKTRVNLKIERRPAL